MLPENVARSLVMASMFDESGNMCRPWARAGWACHCFDILNTGAVEHFDGGGSITYHRADLTPGSADIAGVIALRPAILFGFPPCTDMAVSGARHFEAKRARDPDFQAKAVAMARTVETVGEAVGCPWFAENPVSVLATMWRPADFYFHPSDYGGYLPPDDVHPRWPQYIRPRDAYPKRTGIWKGRGFIVPPRQPVPVAKGWSDQQNKLGGKSAKTKQIRSETPRGWSVAVFQSNVALAAFVAGQNAAAVAA